MSFRLVLVLLFAAVVSATPAFAQSSYYFPTAQQFDAKVPSPQQFLGYDIGSQYTRHDQLVAYFNELARVSDRVTVEVIGQSYEHRPLLLVTITSPRHHARSAQDTQLVHLCLIDDGGGKLVPLRKLTEKFHGHVTGSRCCAAQTVRRTGLLWPLGRGRYNKGPVLK